MELSDEASKRFGEHNGTVTVLLGSASRSDVKSGEKSTASFFSVSGNLAECQASCGSNRRFVSDWEFLHAAACKVPKLGLDEEKVSVKIWAQHSSGPSGFTGSTFPSTRTPTPSLSTRHLLQRNAALANMDP